MSTRLRARSRAAALVFVLALAAVLAVAACGTAPVSPAGGGAAAPRTLTPAPAGHVPAFGHVFVLVLENTEYGTIVGQHAAPYLESLVARGALQTAYYAVAHPSLPNYIALASGDTQGISSDCSRCFVDAPTLADQVEAAGRTWRAYMEDMPAPCTLGNAGGYAQRHDPWVYFDAIRTDVERCAAHVVPLSRLDADLAAGTVPDLAWITPNLCHDMHDCSVETGDAWLRDFLPRILDSAAFRDHGVLFITFDEGTTGAGCCGVGGGGRVFTLVLGPDVRAGARSPVPETHYSLLRTIEDAWGLPPLGHAADAASMTESFAP